MFVSYADNFEDVLLWRAFAGPRPGFYVDLCAGHPDTGSVSRAFYERGWRGLNRAATPEAAEEFAQTRLRDVTISNEPLDGLAALLALQADTEIDWLRLARNSFPGGIVPDANRPRIILIASSRYPLADDAIDPEADGLLRAGYEQAWFDGLTHFYIAEEHAAVLRPCFATPPNVLDRFVRHGGPASALAAAEARAEILEKRVAFVEATARQDLRALMQSQAVAAHRLQEINALAARANEAALQLDAIRRSSSWRVTAPIRAAKQLLGRSETPTPALPVPVPAAPLAAPRPMSPPPTSFPRRTVHQFHADTARGDAITNAMLTLRGLLRGLGYRSEIYCDHPDPALDDTILPSASLPLHDGYVLIVHFSLGIDSFEAIAALPARKVLIYHNITPEKFMAQSPAVQDRIRLGHRQLPLWKPRVDAALADSEFNALDLRAHGFPVVQASPLLFDVDAMQAAAPGEARTDPRFTILFVGRLVESKAQDDLVAAFGLFRAAWGPSCRLVLVGRAPSADSFADRVRDAVARLRLQDCVEFAGFVDDATLHRFYREADLYVSLSHHEGFGVPLVEAMVHGVPVLAWPCGAVGETIGDTGGLLHSRAPPDVAARMLALARDPAQRHAMIRRQARQLDRFRLDRQLPNLLLALARAGAALPADDSTRAVLERGLSFTVSGHVNGSYSLAAVNRGLARTIEAALPGRVRIVPVEGSETTDLSGVPPGEREEIRTLATRLAPPTGPEVVITQHYPVHVPVHRGDALLALFFWEESIVPLGTIRVLNRDIKAVLAPSRYVARVLLESGLAVPVHVIGQAPDLRAFQRIGAARGITTGPMVFLHVSSCYPRKGVDLLLQAYAAAFRRSDPVRLVIKSFPNPHNVVPAQVAAIRRDREAPEIELIDGDLLPEALLDLYRIADVMVLPTRGEGFNLPAAEAMAAQIPVIVTGHGGHMDFCNAGTARLLKFQPAPAQTHVATAGSLWAEPDVADLTAALREALATRDSYATRRQVARAAAAIASVTSPATMVQTLTRVALDALTAPPPHPPRLAVVSSWAVRCGVAEYTRHLLENLPVGWFSDVLVVADDRTDAAEVTKADLIKADLIKADLAKVGAPRVRTGWRLGGTDNTERLGLLLAQEDPDIVFIQHQPGLLGFGDLARILTRPMTARPVQVVTLHNTAHLLAIPATERQETLAALALADRVLVHCLADLERLGSLGLDNVAMVPHGIAAGPSAAPPRPLAPQSAPIIGCHGYLLPGKGVPQLIAAAALLRKTWPKLRLRLVCADYGTPDSASEIATCRDAAARAGLANAIDWHTEFLPEAAARTLLGGCDLVVLPYQSSLESVSGALRASIAAGVPIAVTPLGVFEDAGDAVLRLDGITPEAIAKGAATLLKDAGLRQALLDRATAWQAHHDWPLVAERTAGLLLGLRHQASR